MGGGDQSTGYRLRCTTCEATYEDDGYRLECSSGHGPALLVTQYAERAFAPDGAHHGPFRYASWLPVRRSPAEASGTRTFRSESLSRATGLPGLWVAFNGYWPEREARLETGTFKELEAWTVLNRLPEGDDTVLVIASAGNTGAAFARIASLGDVPCLIVVPERALADMQLSGPVGENVRIVALRAPADYYDAIMLAERVAEREGFVAEGGVRNVGRRDGLATAFLNATETIGRLPDSYFQAVGSGAGAIAAHEAASRLIADGRFGTEHPRLMLSQNAPFTPIFDSWKAGGRDLAKADDATAKTEGAKLLAQVLSNPRPPYSVSGGVFEALTASRGDVFSVTNDEIVRTQDWFEQLEGIDLDPASAVAVASLRTAVAEGRCDRDATVVLNVTGGGRRRFAEDRRVVVPEPALRLEDHEVAAEDAPARVASLFGA